MLDGAGAVTVAMSGAGTAMLYSAGARLYSAEGGRLYSAGAMFIYCDSTSEKKLIKVKSKLVIKRRFQLVSHCKDRKIQLLCNIYLRRDP